MTGAGPTSDSATDPAEGTPPQVPSAVQRANRMSAANMVRSLLPLVVICLLIVGWQAFRASPDVGVRTVDPSSSVQLAAARAGYEVLVPAGLDEDYRPTSARTDAGGAGEGDPVTLEIGYLTPAEEFAGFVVSDERAAEPVAAVLDGAEDDGAVELGGRRWARATTADGETVLWWESEGVIVLVTGSASEEELATVARSVAPYRG